MKKWNIILPLFFITLTLLISFYPSFDNGITDWDDNLYITNNVYIQNLSPENIKHIFTSFFIGNYHPLSLFSYALEYYFFKSHIFIYHITNFIFHLLNTFLVFYLFTILSSGKIFISCVFSILWAIHPLRVESVAWISERKDVMSTFFFLLAFICYIYYIKNDKRKFYYLSLLTLTLSLLSKAMAITFPLLILVVDYFYERIKIKGLIKNLLLEKSPFFIMSFIFGVIGITAQESIKAIRYNSSYKIFDNFLIACHGFLFYLYKTLVPVNLSVFYPYPDNSHGLPFEYLISPFILLAVILAIILFCRYNKKVIFTSLFFLITLLPVLKLLPIGDTIAADRYTYIPSIGLFYLAGEGWYYIFNKYKNIKILYYGILFFLIVILSFFTNIRCNVWQNDITLWKDVLEEYPACSVAYGTIGLGYYKNRDYSNAMDSYNKALSLNPYFDRAYLNRGNLYVFMKDYDSAMKDYNNALSINPSMADAYIARGVVYFNKGNYKKAISDYNRALKLSPDSPDGYYNRGLFFDNMGDYEKAISDYNKVLALRPSYPEVYNNLGTIYGSKGEYEKALWHFDRAIEFKPDFAGAYNNRAYTNYLLGRYDKSWEDINYMINKGYIVDEKFVDNVKKKIYNKN